MKWVCLVKFKSEVLSQVIMEGDTYEEAEHRLMDAASNDNLEDFSVKSIEPFIEVTHNMDNPFVN